MHTTVIYDTKYGATRSVAEMIVERLDGTAEAIEVREAGSDEVTASDLVILGGPIYAGKLRNRLTSFCNRHEDAILARRVGLFITCLYTGSTASQQLEESYPDRLLAHAVAAEPLGGRIRVSELGVIDRFLVSRLGKLSEDADRIDSERIERFTAAVQENRRD